MKARLLVILALPEALPPTANPNLYNHSFSGLKQRSTSRFPNGIKLSRNQRVNTRNRNSKIKRKRG